MSKQNIIKELESLDFQGDTSLLEKVKSLESSQDVLYHSNILIFQSSSIDHKKRLSLLRKINKISSKYKLPFCTAHNLTLSIKVSRELGIQKNLIKDSHKAIELWKTVLDDPLAINGLIFTYTDLGLLFSDYNLNSLAIKYLDRAKSLISECEDDYNPFIKLYVAYAVIYSNMKKLKKSNMYYNEVIKRAESKKDSMTIIPILINTANDFIKNKNYNKAKTRCDKALKFSDKNKEEIYKPYIFHTLGQIYSNNNKYKKSNDYLHHALDGFKKMNTAKMIPEVLYDCGDNLYKQKKYDEAVIIFDEVLAESKKINNYDLEILVLKKLSTIYKNKKDQTLFSLTVNKLNIVLEKQIKNKEKVFSDTNANALKYLSHEIDLSLRNDKNLKLRLEIESKKRKLTTNALISVSEREFLKKIIETLSSQILDNKKVIQLCKERIQNTKDWNMFMKLFNDIHPYFNKYIIKKCSTITEAELRICNLIKMNFSSLEIAEILSISKRGIEQHRYRIRKKLALKSDLTIFIQSL